MLSNCTNVKEYLFIILSPSEYLYFEIIKYNFLQITGKLDLISKNENLREGAMELLWDASNDATKKISIVTSTNTINRNLNVTIINSKYVLIFCLLNGDFSVYYNFVSFYRQEYCLLP